MDAKAITLLHSVITATVLLFILSFDCGEADRLRQEGWRIQDDIHSEWIQYGENRVDINEFLIGVIENFREDMTVGIPELKIPVLDPFESKKPINVNVEDKMADVHANFTNITVEGLSGFLLEHLHADIHNLTLNFHLLIPWIRACGNYSLDGKVIKIMPLRGNGEFRVESHNLSVAARASMVTSEDDRLQLSEDFDVEMDFDKVELDLENFLGGGRWTDVLLKVLNGVSKDLFKKVLPLFKKELNKSLLKVINKKLKNLPITSIIPGSTADEYIDQILLNVRKYVRDKQLDPMKLPDYSANFSKTVMYINMTGESKLYDGWLFGISSIHRADECELNTTSQTISLSAHLGLNNMQLTYKGHAKFMSVGPSVIVGGKVKTIRFYFRIQQSNRKGATPHVEEFEIVELSTVWIEMSGLGPLSWMLKWMMTGIIKLVEDFMVNKLSATVKEYMENEFQKLSFPV